MAGIYLALSACKGDDGSPGRDGADGAPGTGPYTDLPGLFVTVTGLFGGTGEDGAFRAGDLITVDYRLAQNDGTRLEPAQLSRAAIMVSGPTFNYQRVIASQSDLATKSSRNADGSWRYRFSVPIPGTYLTPLNDTPNFTDGELSGQPLLSGTYTLGIEARRDIPIGGDVFRDVANTTQDFLFGSATTLERRAVVGTENCNQCHLQLQAHGGSRVHVENCLLCHTAGAEDRNVASVEGGTPDVAIDFKVMIHKIHAGANLPSVVGVTTGTDGVRDYSVASKPYKIVGYNNSVHDFSDKRFPVWPSMVTSMPRDVGFSALPSAGQTKENLVRSGPVACAKCHGDPDGQGPLPAPAQGDLIWSQPTRAACASCHDDWVPGRPYTANLQTMPAQANDSNCILCHTVSGNNLSVKDAHTHPLVDPARATGVRFDVTSVTDAGGGKLDPGDKVRITFNVLDGANNAIPASSLSRIEFTFTGPTTNPQMMNYQRVATAYFTGNGPYTFDMPDLVFHDPVGTSDGQQLQTFATTRAPVWNVSGALPTLLRRTGTGASSTLAAATKVTQNHIDVAPGTGSSFAKDNYVVIDDLGGTREYMRVQCVEGDRLWFGSRFRTNYKPNLLIAHATGATVQVVTTATIPSTSWSIDASTGVITELVEFGAGEILANYTADFVVPAVYPGALDDSPAIGHEWGDWTGLPLIDGTYTLDMHGARSFTYTVSGENTSYTDAAKPTIVRVLLGQATKVQTVDRVVGMSACATCHDDITFHGGSRRGFEACIQCHGAAGTENTLFYENQATGSPAGTTVEYRSFLHQVHEPVFPAMPGGVANCAACHGANNTAWKSPIERNHPNQSATARVWSVACGSCHQSTAVRAHIDSNTSPTGQEACAICHGPGEDHAVELKHRTR